MRKILGALLGALCLAATAVAVNASPAAASPSFNVCRTVYYSDGVAALKVCANGSDSTSTTWHYDNWRIWNIPAPSTSSGGYGHLEDFSNKARFKSPQNILCGGGTLTDGQTCPPAGTGPIGGYQNDGSTIWVQIDATGLNSNWAPGGHYCRRVFINEGGGTAESNLCADGSPA